MKRSLDLLVLSFAMSIGVTGGAVSFFNASNEGAANADSIKENASINYDDLETPEGTLPISALPRIRSVDATYTGMQSFGRETNFNKVDYFKNLKDYSPRNNIGSCGYVSLSQLLCYYDTFYNDSIVPERYERKNTSAVNEEQAKEQSPGVVQEYYTSVGYSSYYQYCNDKQEENLQAKLTVIHNELNGTNNADKFAYSIGGWDYQTMLNEFYGDDDFVRVDTWMNKSQAEYIRLIKLCIDNDDPVIVHVKHSNGASGAHSIVAYDYDDDNIYAHYGWGDYSAHYNLFNSYDQIYFVGRLVFDNAGHSCSNNYVIDGEGFCGCNVTNKIHATRDAAGNPILYWANLRDQSTASVTFGLTLRVRFNKDDLVLKDDTLIREFPIDAIIPQKEEYALLDNELSLRDDELLTLNDDQLLNYDEYQALIRDFADYDVSIEDAYAPVIIGSTVIRTLRTIWVLRSTSNAVMLSASAWSGIFYKGASSAVGTLVRQNTSIKYPSRKTTIHVDDFDNKTVELKTSDYAFSNTYVATATTKNIVKDGVTITTERLRCGNIYDSSITHKTYTTISAKKSGAGTAYLAYNLGTAVKSISIDLAMWSDSESLDANKGTAVIQYKDANGNWITVKDLLTGMTLSKDKDNMTKVDVKFPSGAVAFRVYSTVKSATGSANKARICIGDLKINY